MVTLAAVLAECRPPAITHTHSLFNHVNLKALFMKCTGEIISDGQNLVSVIGFSQLVFQCRSSNIWPPYLPRYYDPN